MLAGNSLSLVSHVTKAIRHQLSKEWKTKKPSLSVKFLFLSNILEFLTMLLLIILELSHHAPQVMILALRRDNYEILMRYRLTRDLLYWRRYLLWKYLWHLCQIKNLKTRYILTSLANNRILAFDHSEWDPGKGQNDNILILLQLVLGGVSNDVQWLVMLQIL